MKRIIIENHVGSRFQTSKLPGHIKSLLSYVTLSKSICLLKHLVIFTTSVYLILHVSLHNNGCHWTFIIWNHLNFLHLAEKKHVTKKLIEFIPNNYRFLIYHAMKILPMLYFNVIHKILSFFFHLFCLLIIYEMYSLCYFCTNDSISLIYYEINFKK